MGNAEPTERTGWEMGGGVVYRMGCEGNLDASLTQATWGKDAVAAEVGALLMALEVASMQTAMARPGCLGGSIPWSARGRVLRVSPAPSTARHRSVGSSSGSHRLICTGILATCLQICPFSFLPCLTHAVP